MQFHERLKQIRLETAFTQSQMAVYLGMTERGYRNYEIGAREPKLSDLILIADRFNVTLDYLVGRIDSYQPFLLGDAYIEYLARKGIAHD